MDYASFLSRKLDATRDSGLDVALGSINGKLFDWQKRVVQWAVRRGRAAIFADCGLGKTPMQLAWAEHVPGPVLIVAPLAVAQQTVREGQKFGVPVVYARHQDQARGQVTICNYEMLDHFDASQFTGVVLDESSILKAFMGKTKRKIVAKFAATPWKLACTATPAPNDHMELGNHAEFLGVMPSSEMLSRFFINDTSHVGHYRLKGHAERPFWRWMASWSVMFRSPSDLGADATGFDLPPLDLRTHVLDSTDYDRAHLFAMPALTLNEQRKVKRRSVADRCDAARALVDSDDYWLLWCELNDEGDYLEHAIPGALQIAGSDPFEEKERRLLSFVNGDCHRLVTKPTIAGFGLNLQFCNRMIFVNISHSYEQFYQSVRRCWRFGQKRPVRADLFLMEEELAILENIQRKRAEAGAMTTAMVARIMEALNGDLAGASRERIAYDAGKQLTLPGFLQRKDVICQLA